MRTFTRFCTALLLGFISPVSAQAAQAQTTNPAIGVGPVFDTAESCAGGGLYTPSAVSIQSAKQQHKRDGLTPAFTGVSDTDTQCVLMHTSVKVNPDTKSLKAADGKTAGDRWVNVLSRYIYRDKRGRYVYFLCANAIRKLANPVEVATKSSAATLTPKPKPKTVNISVPATTVQINTAPSTTTKEVVDTVIIKRRVHVVYQDEYVYDQPPELMINVPANQYRYSESPQGPIGGQGCVCYHDPKDPKGLVYRYRYPNGQLFCVPKEMGDNTIYPPGYGPN